MKKKLLGFVVIIIIVAVILGVVLFLKFTSIITEAPEKEILQKLHGYYWQRTDSRVKVNRLWIDSQEKRFSVAGISGTFEIDGIEIIFYIETIVGEEQKEPLPRAKGIIDENEAVKIIIEDLLMEEEPYHQYISALHMLGTWEKIQK